jgi:hypothetical protein
MQIRRRIEMVNWRLGEQFLPAGNLFDGLA